MSYDEHLISQAGGDGDGYVLDAIQRRADAALKGPWNAWDRGIGYEIHSDEGWAINDRHRETFTKADAEFIANARTDVPHLIFLVREQALQLEGLRTDMQNAMADAWDEGVFLGSWLGKV